MIASSDDEKEKDFLSPEHDVFIVEKNTMPITAIRCRILCFIPYHFTLLYSRGKAKNNPAISGS